LPQTVAAPVRSTALAVFFAAALAVSGFIPLASAQEEPAPNSKAPAQTPESVRATQMRQFLGLGREPDAKVAAEGAKLFGPTCASCHGASARGGVGPDLLRSSAVLDDSQGEVVGPVIRKGFPDKGMPAFPAFTDDQLRELAEFLHLQVYLAANRGTYEIQNIVTGNPQAGQAYFNGEGKCNTCHSPSGDLAHIASKLKAADLQQALLYPASVGQRTPPQVMVILKDGKTLTGTLKLLDDFQVSLDDSSGNHHSIELEQGIKVNVEDKLVFHRQMLEKYTDAQIHDLTAYLVTLK
jgi:cytochrome c oxidase cbb3-type subunit III